MPQITRRHRWIAGLSLLAVLLFSAYLWVQPLLHIGAGYAAKHACSCHFLQGRALDSIRLNDLNFSVLGHVSLTPDRQAIKSSFYGLTPREAVYRPGYGCTLVNDAERLIKKLPERGADVDATVEFKGDGDLGQVPPESEALRSALDYAMAPVPGGGARGVVILHGGQLIGERYAPGFSATTPQLGWSMTKTLTALAMGVPGALQPYVNGRRVAPDTTLTPLSVLLGRDQLYPHWLETPRAEITLSDLLRMSSGLGWNEGYGSITDATVMLHEQADMARFAAGMPLLDSLDTWNYSSGTTNILVDLLRQDLDQTSLYAHLDSVFGDVAPSLIIEPDQSGKPVGSSYGWATPRDWARLGQFMLQDGVWNGRRKIRQGWIDFMRQPAPGSSGTYGGQLWLPGEDTPSLPRDAFMMRGFQDQRVIVIPSRKLVIVRLGHNDDKAADFDGLIERVLAAVEIRQ